MRNHNDILKTNNNTLTAPTTEVHSAPLKPSTIKPETFKTVCSYCSDGCKLIFHHQGGHILRVTKAETTGGSKGNLCVYARLGYHIFNRTDRITKPQVKENGQFREITYENAYKIIEAKLKSFEPDKSAFFAGARLTNEEQYLIQKFARAAVGTNNVRSFHHIHSIKEYTNISSNNVPFEQIGNASRLFLIGSEIDKYNPVVGNLINSAEVPFEVISNQQMPRLQRKSSKFVHILSYSNFIRAVNHFILSNDLQNILFINENCEGFEEYKEAVLKENYYDLCKAACDCNGKCIEEFALRLIAEANAILIFSEKEVSQQTGVEIKNLALITGNYAKPSSGIIALKEQNNTCGLFYMGVGPKLGVGMQNIASVEFRDRLKQCWGIKNLPKVGKKSFSDQLFDGEFNNILIFGEDPVGTSKGNPKILEPLDNAEFLMVQDAFMTETAKRADLILPASFWFEIGGTFINTLGVIQSFNPELKPKTQKTSIEQLLDLHKAFGLNSPSSVEGITAEALSLFPKNAEPQKYRFVATYGNISKSLFNSGCDYIMAEINRELDRY